MKDLEDAGIDMEQVVEELLDEGVELFVEAMEKLIVGVESAREAAVTGRPSTFESNIPDELEPADRKSTRLNSSHANISYAVFCLKKKKSTLPSLLHPLNPT